MILVGRNDVVLPLVAAKNNAIFDSAISQSIGCLKNGLLTGGVVYTRVTNASCEMTVAGLFPGWITREFIYAAFHFPFRQLDLLKVVGLVRSDNAEALAFDTKLGFVRETIVADLYDKDVDCVIMSMRREDCKWLPAADKWFAKLAA